MLKKLLKLLFVLLLTSLPYTNTAVAEEGVTDTEIHIAQFGPLSGPAKLWGNCLHGAGLAFKLVNEEGGIHGRKIVYHPVDDSYNPAKTKSVVKRMQEKEHIFAWVGGVGTSPGRAVKKYITRRNIPWVGPFSGSDFFVTPPSRNIFALYPHNTHMASTLSSYAINKLKKERVAVIYLNDDYGKSGLKGAKTGLAKDNKTLVAAIPVTRNTSDMKSIVYQLRKTKADTVQLWTIPFQALRIIMVSKQMKYNPQWMGSNAFCDSGVMYKLSRGIIEGLIISNVLPFEDPALIEKYKDAHKRLNGKDVEWSATYHAGICMAEVLMEGLKRCGPDLTRENLIKALEGIQNFNDLGFPISFKPFDPEDPSSRQGMNSIYLQQCLKGGQTKILTGWISK